MTKTYLLFNNETKKEEYVNKNNVILGLYLDKYSLPKLKNDDLQKLKNNISKINNYIPLYNINDNDIILLDINNFDTNFEINFLSYIFNYNYRFPTTKLLNNLINDYKKNKEYLKKHKNKNLEKENIKIFKRLKFMNNFNNDILLKTYIKLFKNINNMKNIITLSKNPSYHFYFNYIKPYYTKFELKTIGINNNIIKKKDIDNSSRIIENFINTFYLDYNDLIKHHNFIIKNNLTSLIYFYTLQGSYNLNDYLRNNIYNSNYYNNLINLLANGIINAPKLNKDIYVYRFIDTNYLKNLKIGNTITEKSFLSTSRNLFYKNKFNMDNSFGWILMKIKIPKKFNYLCIETHSYYPKEQEIILPPNTTFKLNKIYSNFIYPDFNIMKKVKHIYDLEIIEQPTHFYLPLNNIENIPIFNFNIPKKINTQIINFSNRELILNFIVNFTNEYNLFKCKIGDKFYNIIAEEYNSTNSYKKFFANETDHGFYIYSFDDKTNSLLFMIEISEYIMYVNYNVHFENIQIKNLINDKDFLNFICRISLYFNIQKVIYYCDYISCNSYINDIYNICGYYNASYNYDFFDYLKNNNKKFNFTNNKFKPKLTFDYKMFDNLKFINFNKLFFDISFNNNCYKNIYNKYLKNKNNNIKDFFIWIIENYPNTINNFIDLFKYIKNYEHLFDLDYYVFYPVEFMIEEKMINKWPFNYIYSHNDIVKFNNKNFERIRINRDIKTKRFDINKKDPEDLISINEIYN